jgi:hypothetical protein
MKTKYNINDSDIDEGKKGNILICQWKILFITSKTCQHNNYAIVGVL